MTRMLLPAVLAILPVLACPAASGPGDTAPKRMETNEVAPAAVTLGRKPVRVRIVTKNDPPLAARLQKLRGGERLYLVLRGLRAEEPPSTVYHLYLALPPGAKPSEDDPRYVGSINFYESYGGADKFRSFDITDVARRLRSRGLLEDDTVTLRPGTDPGEGAAAVIAKIELVAQQP